MKRLLFSKLLNAGAIVVHHTTPRQYYNIQKPYTPPSHIAHHHSTHTHYRHSTKQHNTHHRTISPPHTTPPIPPHIAPQTVRDAVRPISHTTTQTHHFPFPPLTNTQYSQSPRPLALPSTSGLSRHSAAHSSRMLRLFVLLLHHLLAIDKRRQGNIQTNATETRKSGTLP